MHYLRTVTLVSLLIAATAACSGLKDLESISNTGVGNMRVPKMSKPKIGDIDLGRAIDAGKDLGKAFTMSDAEIQNMALQFTNYADRKNKVAPPSSSYAKRLARLTSDFQEVDGLKLNYKVYLSPDVNAFACADGSVRVHSGLMDIMKDDEVLGVIGHEIGHVKLRHTAKRVKLAALASGVRKGVASANNVGGALAESEVGALFEKFANSQFSQTQEQDSDSYGLRFLIKNGQSGQGAVNAFYKLAKMEEKSGNADSLRLLSSHPAPKKRAQRLAKELSRIKKNPQLVDREISVEDDDSPAVARATTIPSGASSQSPQKPQVASLPLKRSMAVKKRTKKPSVQFEESVSNGWYIQLSAETDEVEANRRKKLLQSQGFFAQLQKAKVRGTTYHRVLVGPYDDRSTAKANVRRAISTGLADGTPIVKRAR